MLMMALETLIAPDPRPEPVKTHVAQLVRLTEENPDLPNNQRDSIVKSLGWLYEESIGQAGRRLASRLSGRRYDDKKPRDFFTDCYDVRSALARIFHEPADREIGTSSSSARA